MRAKEVSRKEIQDFLGVTQTTANLRIKTLIEGGSLEKSEPGLPRVIGSALRSSD